MSFKESIEESTSNKNKIKMYEKVKFKVCEDNFDNYKKIRFFINGKNSMVNNELCKDKTEKITDNDCNEIRNENKSLFDVYNRQKIMLARESEHMSTGAIKRKHVRNRPGKAVCATMQDRADQISVSKMNIRKCIRPKRKLKGTIGEKTNVRKNKATKRKMPKPRTGITRKRQIKGASQEQNTIAIIPLQQVHKDCIKPIDERTDRFKYSQEQHVCATSLPQEVHKDSINPVNESRIERASKVHRENATKILQGAHKDCITPVNEPNENAKFICQQNEVYSSIKDKESIGTVNVANKDHIICTPTKILEENGLQPLNNSIEKQYLDLYNKMQNNDEMRNTNTGDCAKKQNNNRKPLLRVRVHKNYANKITKDTSSSLCSTTNSDREQNSNRRPFNKSKLKRIQISIKSKDSQICEDSKLYDEQYMTSDIGTSDIRKYVKSPDKLKHSSMNLCENNGKVICDDRENRCMLDPIDNMRKAFAGSIDNKEYTPDGNIHGNARTEDITSLDKINACKDHNNNNADTPKMVTDTSIEATIASADDKKINIGNTPEDKTTSKGNSIKFDNIHKDAILDNNDIKKTGLANTKHASLAIESNGCKESVVTLGPNKNTCKISDSNTNTLMHKMIEQSDTINVLCTKKDNAAVQKFKENEIYLSSPKMHNNNRDHINKAPVDKCNTKNNDKANVSRDNDKAHVSRDNDKANVSRDNDKANVSRDESRLTKFNSCLYRNHSKTDEHSTTRQNQTVLNHKNKIYQKLYHSNLYNAQSLYGTKESATFHSHFRPKNYFSNTKNKRKRSFNKHCNESNFQESNKNLSASKKTSVFYSKFLLNTFPCVCNTIYNLPEKGNKKRVLHENCNEENDEILNQHFFSSIAVNDSSESNSYSSSLCCLSLPDKNSMQNESLLSLKKHIKSVKKKYFEEGNEKFGVKKILNIKNEDCKKKISKDNFDSEKILESDFLKKYIMNIKSKYANNGTPGSSRREDSSSRKEDSRKEDGSNRKEKSGQVKMSDTADNKNSKDGSTTDGVVNSLTDANEQGNATDSLIVTDCEIATYTFLKRFLNMKVYNFNSLPNKNIKKIGEATFSDVFLIDNLIYKIMPMTNDLSLNDFFKECFINKVLSNESGIIKLFDCVLVTGNYPKEFLKAFENFKGENKKPKKNIYGVIVMENGGVDLESFVFNNKKEINYFLKNILRILKVLETKYRFEHRDLHWGNILLKRVDLGTISKGDTVNEAALNNTHKTLASDESVIGFDEDYNPFSINIIDFTLSRISYNNKVVYTNLNEKEWLFEGDENEDIQFGIYEQMRRSDFSKRVIDELNEKSTEKNDDYWMYYNSFTNFLWFKYLVCKVEEKFGENTVTKDFKAKMKGIKTIQTLYKKIYKYE